MLNFLKASVVGSLLVRCGDNANTGVLLSNNLYGLMLTFGSLYLGWGASSAS